MASAVPCWWYSQPDGLGTFVEVERAKPPPLSFALSIGSSSRVVTSNDSPRLAAWRSSDRKFRPASLSCASVIFLARDNPSSLV